MQTRVAVISIIIEDVSSVESINSILHEFGEYIFGRMGVPYRAKGINIPIFIDNAESVQEFLPTDSQKILLYVRQGEEMPDGAVLLASDALK